MAKKIDGYIKLQVPAGKANPSPPIGPALGQKVWTSWHSVKSSTQLLLAWNQVYLFPVEITVYNDKSFTFIMKSPPAAFLIRKAAGAAKGSGVPNKTKVGKVDRAQLNRNCH